MPELTSPVAGPIALPAKAAPLSVAAPGVPSLAAFIDVMLGKVALPTASTTKAGGDRQAVAATGNAVPEDKSKDVDPALAWLFGAMPLPAPVPLPTPTATASTALEVAPDIAPDVLIAGGEPEVKPAPVDPQAACDVIIAKPRMFTLPTPVVQPDTISQPIKAPPVQPDIASQPIKLPLLQPRQPAALAPVAAAALPALFALSLNDRSDGDDSPISSLAPASPLTQPALAMPIAPMADAQRQALDMGRQDWPQKMIDHIEALRDNADANDTSIRLKPEALGRVDVALRTHDNGAVSVRFTAEQPTTRTMLADATPQLTAAAEARGIRLSGTSVDLSGQGDQRPQPQAERAQPITNRLATARTDDTQAVDDGRIA